eukprot:scaffold241476_cov12-Tisochrysis_lutea.AAC.1
MEREIPFPADRRIESRTGELMALSLSLCSTAQVSVPGFVQTHRAQCATPAAPILPACPHS